MKDESRKIDAFGIVHDCDRTNSVDLSNPYVDEWGLEYDPETGSTHPVITGKIDFAESIQTFRDSCGVEAAMRDVASGRRTQASLADDGKSGGDFTRSSDIIEAYATLKTAAVSSAQADANAKAKGLDPKDLKVDGLDLDAYIKKQIAARVAASASSKEGESK